MAFREVGVVEVREVLRGWLEGTGLRTVAERSGVDRKTARRYVNAAVAAGLSREAGLDALDDELIGAVIAAVRPARPDGHGASWEALSAREQQIRDWVGRDGLSIVKVEELLARSGCAVPYRTLHRFAVKRCGFRVKTTTMRVVDGEPGVECQIDFAQMGFLVDAETGRRRRVHALIFTAVVSRHMFVWLTYSQTLSAVIAGCEAAWEFFGGVFTVLIPDNLKAVVTDADAVNPRLSTGWLDYAQHAGFGTDPARVRRRKRKGSSSGRMTTWSVRFCPPRVRLTSGVHHPARRVVGGGQPAPRRVLGCAPTDRIAADRAAMLSLPPVAPATGWRASTRLARDHYVRLDANDYSVHPAVIGRRVEVSADLHRVRVFCEGRTVADHDRLWARHQTISDPEHIAAATALRHDRIGLLRPAPEPEVQIRALADYDTALGLHDGDQHDGHHGGVA